MAITAVIVDDEDKLRTVLREKLSRFCPQIEIVGEVNSAKDALPLIVNQNPDLVFLDISMPEESGFDLLNKLPNLDLEIIFVTSFNEFAIEAIKFCAIGYLLKPVAPEELIKAVAVAEKRIETKKENQRNRQLLENLLNPGSMQNRIGIPTGQGLEFVQTGNIIRCEGEQKYTNIFIQNQKDILSSYNLGEFQKLLHRYGFFQPHKSHLINLSHIKRYDREGVVTMSDNSTVPVSRRKRHDFLDQLNRL